MVFEWTVGMRYGLPVVGIHVVGEHGRPLADMLRGALQSDSVPSALRDCGWRLHQHHDAGIAEQEVLIVSLAIFLEVLDALGLIRYPGEEYREGNAIKFVIRTKLPPEAGDYATKLHAAAGRQTAPRTIHDAGKA